MARGAWRRCPSRSCATAAGVRPSTRRPISCGMRNGSASQDARYPHAGLHPWSTASAAWNPNAPPAGHRPPSHLFRVHYGLRLRPLRRRKNRHRGGRGRVGRIAGRHQCRAPARVRDHRHFLRSPKSARKHVAKIAGEKAGIIKEGVPVVSGCRFVDARRVIRRKARLLHAPLLEIDKDCIIRAVDDRHGFYTIDLDAAHLLPAAPGCLWQANTRRAMLRWRLQRSNRSRLCRSLQQTSGSVWPTPGGPAGSMNIARAGALSWRARIIQGGPHCCGSSCGSRMNRKSIWFSAPSATRIFGR